MGRGGSRRWRALRAQVIEQEPYCQLQYEGCTDLSNTADHIVPFILRPDLEYERTNLQGACVPCNRLKSALTQSEADERYGGRPAADRPAALRFFD